MISLCGKRAVIGKLVGGCGVAINACGETQTQTILVIGSIA